ncbi:MAG TPA: GAF domain-containing protein [Kofleriaceae bacterium]|nr:GAF domain-containing protein [Kofleriaceae bacterium]
MKARRLLAGVAKLTAELGRASDPDELLAALLDGLRVHFGFEHTLLMLVDEPRQSLFTLATRGFTPSGVGSEQKIGEGVWGKVAERRAPLRIVAMRRELMYARTVRDVAQRAGDERLTREIALPGLPEIESILAIPIVSGNDLLGVIGAQSPTALAFDVDDENALTAIAVAVVQRIGELRVTEDTSAEESVASPSEASSSGHARIVRYYRADDSIFVDHDYVIKGLPGRILWTLLGEHATGRTTFSNKELRVNPALKLSIIRDNLESRLILLRSRLDEKACGIRLTKRGRGQFGIEVSGPLQLIEVEG